MKVNCAYITVQHDKTKTENLTSYWWCH